MRFGKKRNEKTVTEAEAKVIDLAGTGKVLRFLGGDKVVVEMFPVKKEKPGATSPNKEDVVTSIDVETPSKIPFQIMRKKKMKRVVIARGKFKRGQLWIFYKIKGEQGRRAYYADLSQLSWVKYKTRWRGKEYYKQELMLDVFFCEPVDAKSDTPKWSQDVEDMIVDSKVDQEVEVAQGPLPFKITRTVAIAMIVSGFMFLFVGLSLNSIMHFVPNVVIHWLPG